METVESKRSRRHCMVVHAYYPIQETRVEREAMALLDCGISVDVICLRSPDESPVETVDGVRVYRLPVRRHKGRGLFAQLFEYLAFFVLSCIRLTRLHIRNHYDVVQVHNLPDFLVFSASFAKLTGARIILDLHDLMPEFYAERFQRSMDSLPVRLVRWQEWLSCRFADHIVTVTELWRQALIGRGHAADKVSVVMNVPDDRVFHRDAALGLADSDDSHFELIYHGVMEYRHGLDLALRALDLVRQSAPEVHMILHGGGAYRRQVLEPLVDELGLQDHVLFSSDYVPTPELPRLLRKADLAIVPYRNGVFTGGILPTKLMEYAALGIPSIAARTPAISTYFDETMVQFFTPDDVGGLAQCILELHRDRDHLAKLAKGINEFDEYYNWSSLKVQYADLVMGLAER